MSVFLPYVTSRSVSLSSCPNFWMYLHWPSWMGCPVRWMLSTVSWASSKSHCATNTGPAGQRGRSVGQTLNYASSSVQLRSSGCVVTHFLMWGRLYIQRNSSTPLPREPACSSLAPVLPSTCTNINHRTFSKSIWPSLPQFLVVASILHSFTASYYYTGIVLAK